MTEEEAKTKWCPFVRYATSADDQNACNRWDRSWHSDRPQTACIGSQCMAWRWDMEWASSTEEGSGGDVVLRLKRLKGEPKQGYCGLAGKP